MTVDLRKALEPLASIAPNFDHMPDSHLIWAGFAHNHKPVKLTAADARRAAAALALPSQDDELATVARALRESVACDDAQSLSAFQFLSNRDDTIAVAIVEALAADRLQARDGEEGK